MKMNEPIIETDAEKRKKEIKRKQNQLYYKRHKQKVIDYVIQYNIERRKNDPEYRERIKNYYHKRYKYDPEKRHIRYMKAKEREKSPIINPQN